MSSPTLASSSAAVNVVLDVNSVSSLVEFCLHELALQGLQGCPLSQLFALYTQLAASYGDGHELAHLNTLFTSFASSHLDTHNDHSDTNNLREFVWRLLVAQPDVEFYTESVDNSLTSHLTTASSSSNPKTPPPSKSSKSKAAAASPLASKLSFIVSDDETRGYCVTYAQRRRVTQLTTATSMRQAASTYPHLLLVGSQQLRNRALCPAYKCLEYENLNDLEYCVLEAIARSRSHGLYSTGETGLTSLFDLAPKQLHYILHTLESKRLVKKQLLTAEKTRSIVHLKRYALKTRTPGEKMCDHLMSKARSRTRQAAAAAEADCDATDVLCRAAAASDTYGGVRARLGLTNKQFKSLVSHAERQCLIRRYVEQHDVRIVAKNYSMNNSNPSASNTTMMKTRQTRMVALTAAHFKRLLHGGGGGGEDDTAGGGDETAVTGVATGNGGSGGIEEYEGEFTAPSTSLVRMIGSEQSAAWPLHAQIFANIEACEREGISLKQLGTLYGLDFYRSRRLGNNLQMHPEIVTIIKETVRGKAKYQTIVLRKFLAHNSLTSSSIEAASTQPVDDNENAYENEVKTESEQQQQQQVQEQEQQQQHEQPTEVMLLKRDGTSSKNIQALMSTRTVMRKKLIVDYLARNRVCTKYEITKAIRTYESERALKGCIDAKTTKRMLVQLEAEHKLAIFELHLKNMSYMGVRACDVTDTDECFLNYCATFKRTFDSVDPKYKPLHPAADTDSNSSPSSPLKSSTTQEGFKLTRTYINSIVSSLKFSTNHSRMYALVPKFQKVIVLHRLLTYLLFFNNARAQERDLPPLAPTGSSPPSSSSSAASAHLTVSDEQSIVDSVKVPSSEHIYQPTPTADSVTWRTFIPPFNNTSRSKTSSRSGGEQTSSCSEQKTPLLDDCIFVGEIFSHMPLSVFCSIIVINHHVPGLVAILKHPQKRHILVKDLPAHLLAPLIYERRYLQRMLAILQFLATMGLVTFVESPCMTNQAINRDVQSQMIYVHRMCRFYDTTSNRARDWHELKRLNTLLIANRYSNSDETVSSAAAALQSPTPMPPPYDECVFRFTRDSDVVDYWQRLLHVAMNTFKFNVRHTLHESKKLRQELLARIISRSRLDHIKCMWPIERYGDHMGPGGYDTQLFLHSFKNWVLPSNLKSTTTTTSVSSSPSSNAGKSKSPKQQQQAITKEDDASFAPYSELALVFPFGVFRGIASSSNDKLSTAAASRLAAGSSRNQLRQANKRKSSTAADDIARKRGRMMLSGAKSATATAARHLIDKARAFKLVKSSSATASIVASMSIAAAINGNSTSSAGQHIASAGSRAAVVERRATWHADEDEIILLIKVASLYFLPHESAPSVPFKLISDVMHELMPARCYDKRVSSFGRRIKMLLKCRMSALFVSNKLELCRQDPHLERTFAQPARHWLKRNLLDRAQVDLYVAFINEVRQRFLAKKSYAPGGGGGEGGEEASSSNADMSLLSTLPSSQDENMPHNDAHETPFELPDTMEEFNKRFAIRNSSTLTPTTTAAHTGGKSASSYFKQPTNDYEISCNTLQSAIHSSILITDKNPRVFESFNLFDKYSDQLLNDVITRMSRNQKIIAPTKCSELRKKNVTAFSKHIGKAYHISQRYQYKWSSNITANILAETKVFKDALVSDARRCSANAADEHGFDLTDRDDLGMTSFLAHTIDNSNLQVQIDVPNKIWVSKLI